MDSSKRHWPSMFKSKSSVSSQDHQWQLDTSPLISTPTSTISSVTEERTSEPKPRWNPKPEQIRILEGIFNSGMVTPPRDEIRRIRAQLQEYGQVGDANVFYWFQNRKSRSKNKKTSNLQNSITKSSQRRTLSKPKTPPLISYTSSCSFDKSLQISSPTCSVNQQPYFSTTNTSTFGAVLPEPYPFPTSQSTQVCGVIAGAAPLTRGFCFPEVISSNINYVAHNNNYNVSEFHGQTFGKCSTSASVLLTDLMNAEAMNDHYNRVEDNYDTFKMQQQLSYSVTDPTATPISAQTILPPPVMSNINHIQGECTQKCMVFINDVAFEVASGPFDVRQAFGEDVVLLHSSGLPVLTDQWGVTLQSLQHGAFYYLFRIITTPSPPSL